MLYLSRFSQSWQ